MLVIQMGIASDLNGLDIRPRNPKAIMFSSDRTEQRKESPEQQSEWPEPVGI
jgi:hypothetical protein